MNGWDEFEKIGGPPSVVFSPRVKEGNIYILPPPSKSFSRECLHYIPYTGVSNLPPRFHFVGEEGLLMFILQPEDVSKVKTRQTSVVVVNPVDGEMPDMGFPEGRWL